MFRIDLNIITGYPFIYLKDSDVDFLTESEPLDGSTIQIEPSKIVFFCNPWYERINTLWISVDNEQENFDPQLKFFGYFTIQTPSGILTIQDEQSEELGLFTYMRLPCQEQVKVQVFTDNPNHISIIGIKIFTGDDNV